MARLLVEPGSPAPWEIHLKPGTNSLGRGPDNDFKLADGSVSGAHCQIIVEDGKATLKDLGSTNGTFVNRAPVKEAVLTHGQKVHLGGLEMLFCSDETASTAPTAQVLPPRVPAVAPPPVPRMASVSAIRITAPLSARPAGAPAAAGPAVLAAESQVVEAAEEDLLEAAAPSPLPASGPCNFHPRVPGRFFCSQCGHFFCELCVTSRVAGGVARKFCRHCGVEVKRTQVQLAQPASPKGFFALLPGTFVYPFRGSGVLVLIVSTLVFAALGFVGGGFMFLAKILALGYLFAYMQNIIHATANEEDALPELPGMDGLFGACFRLLGCVVLAFGAAIALACMALYHGEIGLPGPGMIAAIVFGCLYFPMALLAVAMKDSVLAANPLVVVPAAFKVPLQYLVTTILLTGVFALRWLGSFVAMMLAGNAYSTRSMSVLFIGFGLRMFWSFASVYLLTVTVRILGLLYVTNKHKFGWFNH
jgi:hypothetical protein